MIDPLAHEIWFVTGSQHLYGDDTLALVDQNARQIGEAINGSDDISLSVVTKPLVTSGEEARAVMHAANGDPRCAGVILWMHTFSPARMWIDLLEHLQVPFLHLHTQFARDLPWQTIDMDYMNAHQAAHGDREFAFMASRLRRQRKIVAGHWEEPEVMDEIGVWCQAAFATADANGSRLGRLGDNMREVAVTEGDKVEFQRCFGYEVNGFGVGELAQRIADIDPAAINKLLGEYDDAYTMAASLRPDGDRRSALRDAAAIEGALRQWLADEQLIGFTDTFQDLTGIPQLPGIAAQRLMADGFGFGAEGDWKTAALVRAVKVMGHGRAGGASFMEDYTYHLDPSGSLVLGAHMLEVCPTISSSRPSCEIHELAIGERDDPVRLVFDASPGVAVNTSVVDLGDRFRMTAAVVDVVEPPHPMPALPTARAVWQNRPDLRTAAKAWMLSGGSHHSAHSSAVTVDHIRDFARNAGVELIVIDENCSIIDLERELLWNDVAYRIGRPS